MTRSITQCPHCRTRFRVGLFQLTAARGLARCGACLGLFNARRHACTDVHLPPTPEGVTFVSATSSTVASASFAEVVVGGEKSQKPVQAADSYVPLIPAREGSIPPMTLEPEPVPTPARGEPADWVLDEEGPPHWQWRAQRAAKTRWTWPLLIFAAGIFCGLSIYTYRHFEELAQVEETRPWLTRMCQLLGCRVPLPSDPSQIKSANLIVQTHPDFKGALLVEAVLYNRATFTQAFPVLELKFTDVNGWPLASRLFKPSDYLGNAAEQVAGMAPQTPVHISIEVLDPGENAVSYTLNFLPAESVPSVDPASPAL